MSYINKFLYKSVYSLSVHLLHWLLQFVFKHVCCHREFCHLRSEVMILDVGTDTHRRLEVNVIISLPFGKKNNSYQASHIEPGVNLGLIWASPAFHTHNSL
jgi:hypothetical protein